MVRVSGEISMNLALRIFAACVFLCLSIASTNAQDSVAEAYQPVDLTPLRELGDDYHNSIKLLQNRFRIDYEVEEITMVFFRKYGSPPVVLVQPDGSKIFQVQADGENVFWYDAATYDLINIKHPTPGPWQAVGQLLPESRVMVISDIQLIADPLPDVIFSGEILKQTARLTNGGEPINNAEFRDVVSLDIRLVSTNNPNFDNFGAEVQTIATFEDNGRGMDERPLDGVFTGQFNLAVADGEWTPVFVVSTPMLTREQVDSPLMLYPNPITVEMVEDGGGDGYHKLVIDAHREHVDMKTLLIDGKVRFPNGDVQNFSLTEQTAEAREHLIVNYEEGVYRVKLTAYGNTLSGRDFILDVPEKTFLVEKPEVVVASETNAGDNLKPSVDTQNPDNKPSSLDTQDMSSINIDGETKATSDNLLFWILAVNGVVIIIGGILIWLFVSPPKSKSKVTTPSKSATKLSIKDKLKNILPKKTKKLTSGLVIETPKTEKGTDFIELSMPKK